VLGLASLATAEPDPQYDPEGYAAWCRRQNGEVYNNASGYGCAARSSPSSAPTVYGGNPYEALFGALFTPIGAALAEQMACALDPSCGVDHAAIQRAEEQRQAVREHSEGMTRARQERIQELKEREAEKRRRLALAKERILGEMGNMPGGLGTGPGLPELRVEPKKGAFGDSILTSPDLKELARADAQRRQMPSTEVGRARCAAYLLVQANRSAAAAVASGEPEILSGRLEEARYLSEQAALLMGGGGGSASGVGCPGGGDNVPEVVGAPIAASALQAERLEQNTRAYTHLFKRAKKHVDDYRAAQSQLNQIETEVDQAKQRAEEAKLEVERLKQAPEPAPPADLAPEPAPTDPDAEDDALLAEALAALEQSEQALADAERLRDEEQKNIRELEQRIGETGEMIQDLQRNPDHAEGVLAKLEEPDAAKESP
jgi:hypothetical protein